MRYLKLEKSFQWDSTELWTFVMSQNLYLCCVDHFLPQSFKLLECIFDWFAVNVGIVAILIYCDHLQWLQHSQVQETFSVNFHTNYDSVSLSSHKKKDQLKIQQHKAVKKWCRVSMDVNTPLSASDCIHARNIIMDTAMSMLAKFLQTPFVSIHEIFCGYERTK